MSGPPFKMVFQDGCVTLGHCARKASGGKLVLQNFFPLRFGTKLARLWVKFAEPYGTGFALCGEFTLKARLGFRFDAPAGHILIIKGDASHFFLLLVEIDQS